jgi:hypothetical protein
MKRPRFIIYTPPYNPYSGGIVVLHKLGELLNALGESVFLETSSRVYTTTIPLWRTDSLMDTDIVIYPEIIKGNPLNAKNVVRWILNTPGIIKQDTQSTWNASDLIYKFLEYFKVDKEANVKGILRCLSLNLELFNNASEQRSLYTYSTRKHSGKKLNYHSNIYKNIDRDLQDFKKLNKIFNTTNIFISYDTVTYYSLIAAVCGATSIVVPDENITREEWYSKTPTLKFGVGYGLEDLDWAVSTKHLVRDYLLALEKENEELVRNFIQDCYRLIN